MTSAAWLVMSMNGGLYLMRSSIRASRPLASPPRRGGMISKLISGCLAFARCSMTFMVPADRSVQPGLQLDPHLGDHGDDVGEDGMLDAGVLRLAFEALLAGGAVDEPVLGVKEFESEGDHPLLVLGVLAVEGGP